MLNPNCSEVVWKLNLNGKSTNKVVTWTDSYPNQALDNAIKGIRKLTKNKSDIDNIYFEVSNDESGGDINYVERVFDIARKVVKGKMTLAQAKKEEHKGW